MHLEADGKGILSCEFRNARYSISARTGVFTDAAGSGLRMSPETGGDPGKTRQLQGRVAGVLDVVQQQGARRLPPQR